MHLLVGVRLLIIFKNNKTNHLFKVKAQEALSQSLNHLISSNVSVLSLISSSSVREECYMLNASCKNHTLLKRIQSSICRLIIFKSKLSLTIVDP